MEKVYNTKQKSIILDILRLHNDENFTAEELGILLKHEGYDISRATLFRTLDRFTKDGLIKKFFKDNSKISSYQYLESECLDKDHIHLVCTNCGRMIHADINSVRKVDNEVLRKYGFNIEDEKTMLYGVCNECKEAHHEEN